MPLASSDAAAGSLDAPLRTVQRAVTIAHAGQTVVLRRGTYHESVIVDKGPVTIAAYPGEAVWFDGSSAVSNWTRSGSIWVHSGWDTTFDSSVGFTFGQDNPVFLSPGYPMAAHPDQLFLDGTPLRQVADAASVTPGTFAVDYPSHRLLLGTDPSGRSVSATDLQQAIRVNVPGVALHGFGVRRYGTPMPLMGAVRFNVAGSVENVEIDDAATNALSFSRQGAVINHVTIRRAGELGVHADSADGLVLANSFITDSNFEHFNPWIATGGVKVTSSRNVSVRNNEVTDTPGVGIWFDASSVGIRIVDNVSTGNTEAGIEAELSASILIADNVVGGGLSGIYLFNAGDAQIYNNDIGDTTVQGILLSQNGRRQADPGQPGHDRRYPIPDPSCPWLLRNIDVANNVLADGPVDAVMALDKQSGVPADAMNIRIDGNLFSRKVAAKDSNLLAWGGGDNRIQTRMTTVAQLREKNSNWRNVESADSASLSQLSALKGTFAGAAVPLPADVAAALGVTPGLQRMGTF